MLKRVYLDTDLWNALFDQKADPKRLMDRLARKGACLTFSSHNLYEIAKSFHQTEAKTKAKGRDLVQFLLNVFEGPVLHPIDNAGLLVAELDANRFVRGVFMDEVFLPSSGTTYFRTEARALLELRLRSDIEDFISQRKAKVAGLRANQMRHLAENPNLLARLKTVRPENLSKFLSAESRSDQGIKILEWHLSNVIPNVPLIARRSFSNLLLSSGDAPFAHSLVRATLYTNWRAANNGGL